jgi:Fic family protein
MYIHELNDWPRFRWSAEALAEPLASVSRRQGRLIGHMEALGFNLQQGAVLQTLTADVLKSSEIEGEKLDAGQVRSSIAQRLGMDIGALKPADRHVEGVVEMMLDATRRYNQPLTEERLFAWHASLFPTGQSGMIKIRTGAWRDDSRGPMQVVSGPMGKERVQFEAPKAERLPGEMRSFLDWFEGKDPIDPVLKAGLAHLWFVTIHPFDDGNGRIARAIADMSLARSENSPQRFYSMSTQIRQERNAYYDILETTQEGTMDVAQWMEWFLGCLGRAIDGAQVTLSAVLRKARFWERIKDVPMNERQRLVVNGLLDGFEGKLTTSKYAVLTKCSQDTAHRDILALGRYRSPGSQSGRWAQHELFNCAVRITGAVVAAVSGAASLSHQLLPSDGKLADALTRGREDGVAKRRGDGRYAGLSHTSRWSVAFHDVHAGLDRRFVHAENRVIVEVALVDLAVAGGDFAHGRQARAKHCGAFELRAHPIGIDNRARVHHGIDARDGELALRADGHLHYRSNVGEEAAVRRDTQTVPFGQAAFAPT